MRLLLLFALCLTNYALAQTADSHVTVTLQEDGTTCVVTTAAIPCDDLGVYFRDTLRLSPSQLLAVALVGPADLRESRGSKLVQLLRSAGFEHVIVKVGFITEPTYGLQQVPVTPANPRLERP